MSEPTPSLADFMAAYAKDDNAWWRLEPGDHQNLFDEALERIAELEAVVDAFIDADDDSTWLGWCEKQGAAIQNARRYRGRLIEEAVTE